jgi:hypothetical protein
LADRIARSLGRFNAVHLRRGDFRYAGLTPRAGRVTGDEVARNLAGRLDAGERLVVCTDTSSEHDWFAPLRAHFRDVVFLDRLLLDGAEWRAELRALPHHDDAVLGLLTQLVAAQADCFVGTLFSSFTALIQRMRGFDGRDARFLFSYSDWDPRLVPYADCEFTPVGDGPYSWNRVLYPLMPGQVSWFRDWPEAFRAAPVELPPPYGAVELRAAQARVHGKSARYERSMVHDNIGYWTNRDDFVTWEFSLRQPLRCRFEVRYACGDDSAGSRFAVVVGGRALDGTVLGTGGWTNFASWQPLGALELAAGTHTLAVRVTAMPGPAVMNLWGVRLRPA